MEGFIDIHSHILPDMDDGSDSIEETMEILKTAYSEGIRIMIATPHSYSEGSGNIVEDIDRRLEEIRKIADRPPIEIYKGCEIYYTHEVPELLSEKKLPVLAGSRYVLVEFSPVTEYIYITNALRNIMLAGYSPIVAHVERYMAVTKEIGRIEELIDMGAYIQVNAKSITGESFSKVYHSIAKKLLKNRWIHFVATDTHNNSSRAPKMKKCAQVIAKKCGQDYVNEILIENPGKVLHDECV